MLELLRRILTGQNQFASGGLLLMIIGGISVYLRAVPMRIWAWLMDQSTMSITIKDDDAAFTWVKEWFLDQRFLKRVRRLDLDTTLQGRHVALIPAPFRVAFYRSEETNPMRPRRHELLHFRTIGRNQGVLWQFVNEIVECHRRNAVRSCLFVYDDGWSRVAGYVPRVLDSVILSPGEKERLLADIRKFKSSRQRYRDLGVPYHRGYLFYGPPGTGKTSLVSAVAQKFGMSIYAINLAHFNDRSLVSAMNDVDRNSVILFEDIDCMKSGEARPHPESAAREKPSTIVGAKEDRFGVTLSGLLSALDGFSAPDDVLFVMTSNQMETLDSALLRPGRIDYRLFLGPATKEQKVELYRRFFPHASMVEVQVFVESYPRAQTMADFQGLLLGLEESGSTGVARVKFEGKVPEPVRQRLPATQ
jgi:mitochondrial chaperone BCS1